MSNDTAHLRLVGSQQLNAADPVSRAGAAELEVIKENRIAAHSPALGSALTPQVDPHDPRWILAMQTQARLQGAVLPPERRDELIKNGRQLGLRPFESNLVIAIMQDRARSGLGARHATPALSLVYPPEETPRKPAADTTWPKWFAAAAAGATLGVLLIRWIGG